MTNTSLPSYLIPPLTLSLLIKSEISLLSILACLKPLGDRSCQQIGLYWLKVPLNCVVSRCIRHGLSLPAPPQAGSITVAPLCCCHPVPSPCLLLLSTRSHSDTSAFHICAFYIYDCAHPCHLPGMCQSD